MDILEDNFNTNNSQIRTNAKKIGFIEHVFYLNETTKYDLYNILQYVLLAIIPIIVLNKLIQKYVPGVDYEKDSLQIIMECILQLGVLFIGMFFIHRMITFIPTYSSKIYGEFNLLASSMTFLIIILGLQTKLGEKIELLYYRVLDLWDGSPIGNNNTKKVNKPYHDEEQQQYAPKHQDSRSDNLGNNDNIPQNTTPLPPTIATHSDIDARTNNSPSYGQNTTSMHDLPRNFDNMYQEPMAANDSLSGFGGSNW